MNTTNLLQHQINKFGMVTVMDAVLRDPETKEAVLLLDTLKITSIEQEASQKEIRGGIGAPKLIVYDYARNVTLQIQDALASLGSLQLLWGGELLDSAIDYTATFSAPVVKTAEVYTVEVPTEITMNTDNQEEVIDKALIIDTLNKKTYKASSVDGAKLVLEGTPAEGTVLKVFLDATMATDVEGGVAALAVKSTSLPPTVHFTGMTYVIDANTGKRIAMELTIPLLKVNVGGGLTMEAEGDAAVFDFNGDALADPITKNFFVLKNLGAYKE